MTTSLGTALLMAANIAASASSVSAQPITKHVEDPTQAPQELSCGLAAGLFIAAAKAETPDNKSRRKFLALMHERLSLGDCQKEPTDKDVETCVDVATGTKPSSLAKVQVPRAYAAGVCIRALTK